MEGKEEREGEIREGNLLCDLYLLHFFCAHMPACDLHVFLPPLSSSSPLLPFILFPYHLFHMAAYSHKGPLQICVPS